MKRKVCFRADGNAKIGFGHVVRSAALAAMLEDDFECHFFIQNPLPDLKAEVTGAGAQIHILAEGLAPEAEALQFAGFLEGSEVVVLDGYQFGTSYQQEVKRRGCKLVCIDDVFGNHFVADAIINHGGGLATGCYSCEPFTRVYLGPAFALLRKPFLMAGKRDLPDKADEVFICLGGSDAGNETLQVLRKLEGKGVRKRLSIVVGEAYAYMEELTEAIGSLGVRATVVGGADATTMAEMMSRSRYAVCSPSMVSYEYLSLGGELYLVLTANNQQHNLHFFLSEGLAFLFDEFPVPEPNRIAGSMVQQARFFDGKSDSRLRQIFEALSDEFALTLRRASTDDALLLHEWANDEEVRRGALEGATIPLDHHLRWVDAKLRDPHAFLYVIEKAGIGLGQVRFEVDAAGKEALLSYSVAAPFRGRGLGVAVVRLAGTRFREDWGRPVTMVAVVKKENLSSRKVFERLAFVYTGEEWRKNVLCDIFVANI